MRDWNKISARKFSEIHARERAIGLVDKDTFTEFLGPRKKFSSPHLPLLGVAVEFDDGLVSGMGLIDKHPVFVNSMEGKFIGGSIGEVGGAKLVMSLRLALETYNMIPEEELESRRPLVVISFETGGVRLHEANAGLLAHAEVIDAIQDLRHKVPVIAVIGSKVGCFGGMGFVAAATDVVVMSDVGRLGLTGPEVIEQEVGKEEFDASDKSLVYRTTGGKHKYIVRDCNYLVPDKTAAFRDIINQLSRCSMEDIEKMRRIGSMYLVNKQLAFINEVLERDIRDSRDLWRAYGNSDIDALIDSDVEEFLTLVQRRPL
ncbi:biotin-independent malonate decarboxylase subunit beta [Cloacibacillus sp. An23]|uniref:biotin-independent malonate decarboxylase subunit beta n=1 Tax=Cloacibacillus sp. An23 TaxID=1965591 RepID=UPI000B39E2A5|nr:biotin-independent malonate decarboxylase subunit beta [Cloacibacillus sp. An23]OUO92972.1 biotin-independent malonate decarboxylase subunit beta [Cloacibacillus sp. An23]